MSRINALSPSLSVVPPNIPGILTVPLTQGIPNRYCCHINKHCFFSLLMIFLLLGSGRLYAESLNLNLNNQSDIVSGFVDVEYFADDAVYAEGFALELDHDGDASTPGIPIVGGSIEFYAVIDADGNMDMYDGELFIYGAIPDLNLGYELLLETYLVEFGFRPDGGDPLEFIYEVYAGELADLYGGEGATGGLIMSRTGFKGSFDDDFDNKIDREDGTGVGVIDIAPRCEDLPCINEPLQ